MRETEQTKARKSGGEQRMREMETDQMDKVWRDLDWGDGLDWLPLGPFYLSKCQPFYLSEPTIQLFMFSFRR